MEKRQMLWKTKGMNKDLSVSAFNPEFAFENMNLRLSTNERNTLMSWVNEKGTKEIALKSGKEFWEKEGTIVYEEPIPSTDWNHYAVGDDISILGTPIGTAVIDHKLILFTTGDNDIIYKIWLWEYVEEGVKKYKWLMSPLYQGDLNFDTEHPLETLVSYEMEDVQKVYWVDGKNQPRVINIEGRVKEGVNTQFDFVPALGLKESIEVSKSAASGGGLFAPGVIQYGFTYVNKYGQESNMVMVSPIQYLSHVDRGASPDEMVTDSFTITINDVDPNFDYLRLYSIHRSSLNDVPQVKMLEELPVNTIIEYTDSGTVGSSVDPESLLFIGGKEISAFTLIEKDNTLFLGNIEEKNNDVSAIQIDINEIVDSDIEDTLISFKYDSDELPATNNKKVNRDTATGYYSYQSQMTNITPGVGNNRRRITTFKGGEKYRFGFQLQKYTGEWSEPIYIKDKENKLYPESKVYNDKIKLPYVESTIPLSVIDGEAAHTIIDTSIYKKIRPLVVYPSIGDRQVLCQGVLNPTVFNVEDRKQKLPYSQASWYFRPYTIQETTSSDLDVDTFVHYYGGISESDWNNINNTLSDYPIENVWILTGWLTLEQLTQTLSNGFLTIRREWNNSDFYSRYRFIGATYLNETSTPSVLYQYAFCITSAPPTVAGIVDVTEFVVSSSYACNTYFSDNSYPLYKAMGVDSNKLYFVSPSDAIEYYNFKFKLKRTTTSSLIFAYIKFDSISNTESLSSGSVLNFKHYDSIYSDENSSSLASINSAKQVEIQGSKNLYENPFAVRNESVNSNSQFFIDQSIVTLNSPDIEFDTEVQNYGTDGLKLRVVGAIPITGNVSAHELKISSAMLPLEYNDNPDTTKFGSGELNINTLYTNIDVLAGKRLVSDYLWNDAIVYKSGTDIKTKDVTVNYLIYPWQRTGPLNNDPRSKEDTDGKTEASSWLEKKKESNLLYSINTEYFDGESQLVVDYNNKISAQIHLTQNDYINNIRLPKQKDASSDINYYPNVDKILYNEDDCAVKSSPVNSDTGTVHCSVSMKYKSTSHAVIALDDSMDSDHNIFILPSGKVYTTGGIVNVGEYDNSVSGITFWGDTDINFNQSNIDMHNMFPKPAGGGLYTNPNHNWLWLGELYKEPINPFGGTGREAILANNWVVGGDAIDLLDAQGEPKTFVTLRWTEGDTYFQRYDCLKTYPFSPEDTNQLVEILSFMVETHVNLDGRYDKNRGQQVSYNMTPENFNLMNYVYSQQDNFFTYKKVDIDGENKRHPNQIAYSLTKTPGADVDLWTNVNMGSILELDGDKGEITKLMRLNDQLLAFQDSGISQILYNENVQISTEQGVPIEIANSGKVQGARYLSNTIGCSNKWSMAQTPAGIYFMDSNDKSIYLLGEGLKNVTLEQGFNTWAKQEIKKGDGFKAFYDKLNQEVLFINQDRALAWSEKIGAFTSFYSYGGAPYFVNLDDEGLWVNKDNGTSGTNETDGAFKLWKHQGGDYGKFFGVNEPYWTILVGNPNPQMDKTFTNLEFRACVDGDGVISAGETSGTVKFYPTLPFDSLEVWNEYQHGEATLELRNGQAAAKHHTNDGKAGLNRKFRIWRCDIPRDNWDVCLKPDPLPVDPAPTQEEIAAYEEAMAAYNDEVDKGIYRYSKHPLDRMRNPWLYLKLMKEAATDALQRTEVHDMMMSYFV